MGDPRHLFLFTRINSVPGSIELYKYTVGMTSHIVLNLVSYLCPRRIRGKIRETTHYCALTLNTAEKGHSAPPEALPTRPCPKYENRKQSYYNIRTLVSIIIPTVYLKLFDYNSSW